jgi:gluconolactonase
MKQYLYYLLTLLAMPVLIHSCKSKPSAEKKLEELEKAKTEFVKTGSVERLDPVMDDIIPPGELPEIIAEGFSWTEGPLWLPDQEMLLFSVIPENIVYQWSEKGGLKEYLKPSGYTDTVQRGGEVGSNGLLLDPDGHLILCQHGDRRMARMDAPLDDPRPDFTTLADNFRGARFNSPNDAVYNSSGDLLFTDPAYGMELRFKDPKREMKYAGVFKLTSEGELNLLTDQMPAPNGIGLSTDESKLFVANSGGGDQSFWMVFGINKDGSLDEGRLFHDCSTAGENDPGAPDGLEVRDDGVIFATGPGGVWIFTENGRHLGTVKTGQRTSNCTVGDEGKYLYMTVHMYVMRIRLK